METSIPEAMRIAVAHHQAGRVTEAETIYRRVLERKSDHPDALHLLGVLACQAGHLAMAIDLIQRAITIEPSVAQYHVNLGEAHRRAGEWDEAIQSLRCAINLKPDLVEAHHNLGITLQGRGRLEEAIAAYQRAVQLAPRSGDAYSHLGMALELAGKLDEAIDAFNRAVSLLPVNSVVHNSRGLVLRQQGRLDEAIAAFERALELMPDHAECHNNLGIALKETGRPDDAIVSFRRAIELQGDMAEAHHNLGMVLIDKGRHEEACVRLKRSLELQPGSAEAYNGLGMALSMQARHEEALAAYRQAILLKPDYAAPYNNLGCLFKGQGRLDDAADTLRRAIALKPDYASAYNSLGGVLRDQGRVDLALESLRKAVALEPDHREAASNILLAVHYHPEYTAQAILEEHRQWARRFADPLAARVRPHSNDRAPERRLRIGFVAPDLYEHPIAALLLPLFARRDRRQIEIWCYSPVRAADNVTGRLAALADRWQSTIGLSDEQLTDLIRADQIDVLVDLTLHTAGNRMLVFARKPAPVQVTMLGMPATTGLAAMDYRVTDPYLDPPGRSEAEYTERSIRLPHCFWCFEPPEGFPAVGELPAATRGCVTFGCLNDFAKASRPALQLWIELLRQIPDARLVLQAAAGSHRDATPALFREGDIAGDRLDFVPRAPRLQYFERYRELDLTLDPFPYNGHTSSLDSLWMGVPMITLAGRTAVGRGGVSILSNLGMPELIARTPEQYIDLAVAWASDPARLSAVRASLRERMRASPLMDGAQYAADVEAAFRQVWRTWWAA